MLIADDVHVTLAGAPVLRGVSLYVAPGELVAVIGPNGAGKSTLLHVLSGATPHDAGAVRLDGGALAAWSSRALARRRAVLPQDSPLGFPFRVAEVVMLGRSPHAGRSSRSRDRAITAAALRETHIEHLAERRYPTLSGGERQRVQLARVLAQVWPEPDSREGGERGRYLLLDEPTNHLDLAHQQAILTSALRFAATGSGVLAVLHDPNLAAIYADRICVLEGGELVADGPPGAVLDETLLERTFGVRAQVVSHPRNGRPIMLPEPPPAASHPLASAASLHH